MEDFNIIAGELIKYFGNDSIVKVPDSVKRISAHAFSWTTTATRIEIPDSVVVIDEYAFSGCTKLTSIKLSNSITSIEFGTFNGCKRLKSIKIPNSVTHIGSNAFIGCTSLTSIEIPNSVTSIGEEAFADCHALTNIKIPESVLGIGWNTFDGCEALESIDVAEGNINYASVDGALYDKEKKTLIRCPQGKTSINISNLVTQIKASAFWDCINLTNIIIPDSVTSIEYGAFLGCSDLQYNEYDNGLYLGNKENPYVFLINTKSEDITTCSIKDTCKIIGDRAFMRCELLTSIIIPDSVISIGRSAFDYCTGLTSVTIGNGVTSIGDGAFIGCSELTSITIPNSVTEISGSAFYGCTGLTSINVAEDNLNYASIDGVLYSKDKKTLIRVPGLTSFTIPNSVTSVGDYAFKGCTGLTSVTIPNSVTSIGREAFSGCTGLTNIIGDNVKSIGGGAFKHCKTKHNPKGNIAYKGFLVNMTCRDFQYKEGETYMCDEATLCECGFHACLNPLDCFNYYYDNYVVYHEVILEDRTNEIGCDSKICGKKITIGRQLTIQEMFAIFNELNKE